MASLGQPLPTLVIIMPVMGIYTMSEPIRDAPECPYRGDKHMRRLLGWLGDRIAQAYHWVVVGVLCREYYTSQFTKMAVRHGILFWLCFYAIAGVCYYNIFVISGWTHRLMCGAGLIFLAWLSDHLMDTARNNPETYNEWEIWR